LKRTLHKKEAAINSLNYAIYAAIAGLVYDTIDK
jgi:hypothetical protein